MKKFACLILFSIFVTACQKSINNIESSARHGLDSAINSALDSGNVSSDSLVVPGDTLTYEVITTDPTGWAGIWNDSTRNLVSNALDSATYGRPVYLPSGWRYTFVCPAKPFQALISVASFSYQDDITVKIYKNSKLIKTSSNDAMKGVAKLLLDTKTDTPRGTLTDPELTYEILISDQDTSKFESDGWLGQWNKPDGIVNDLNNPLPSFFAMPAGWKYTFKPNRLPFTMYMAASPYMKNGAKITVNFYVNEQLVKSESSRDWIYGMKYIVQ